MPRESTSDASQQADPLVPNVLSAFVGIHRIPYFAHLGLLIEGYSSPYADHLDELASPSDAVVSLAPGPSLET